MRSLSLILLAASLALAQPPKQPSVSGVVTNATGGDPVAKAHVTLQTAGEEDGKMFGAITTADGRFSIDPITPGRYRATVARARFVMSGRPMYVTVERDAAELKLK